MGGLAVRFHGVRGSTPCEGRRFERYGGQTSCVELASEVDQPLLLDLGTGVKSLGEDLAVPGYHANVLLTHLHWDHVQGLPFFLPLHDSARGLDVYGPVQPDGPLVAVFQRFMGPPFFPITTEGLEAAVEFHDVGDDHFAVGDAKVRARFVRHCGPTLGFRVEQAGASVAYIPDHGPGCVGDGPEHIPDAVFELCDGVDLLIHDGQYSTTEYDRRREWGHSTVDYAVHVAAEAGASELVLFHHDPYHDDATVDALLGHARELASRQPVSLHVSAAREGRSIDLTR